MDENMSVGLRDEIIAELTVELSGEPTFKEEILKIKVNDAYRKVRARKAYHNTSFDDEKIEKHLYDNHYQDIKDVALYNYNKIGAEGQVSHAENNINRTWRTEDEIMGNINAFVGIL